MQRNNRFVTIISFTVLAVLFLGTAYGRVLEPTQYPVADIHLSSFAITW